MPPADTLSIPRSWPGPVRAVVKYFNIYRVSLIERLAYRGDFFLGTVLRFLPMVTTILLWEAVYTGASRNGGGGNKTIAGYDADDMIAYLLLVHISRMFSSMPGLATGMARDIRDGTVKKYLIQPLDMMGYLLSYRAAHKTAYIATTCLPYALLFGVCHSYFKGFPDAPTFAAYVVSLLLAFIIGFFFEYTMGLLGFWFLEVSSFLYVINTLNFFLSGHMFPLTLLDASPHYAWAGEVLRMLPFQYLAYFPAAVFLGKIEGPALVNGLLLQAGWAVALVVIARLLFRRGLRQYSAYGG
jgi:ABC-2 type transport system permease protein